MSKFFPAASPRTMYHCIPTDPAGDNIRPSSGYGTTIPEEIQKQLGLKQGDPLVFASAFFSKALAFSLAGNFGEKILNAAIPGSDAELVLICDRDVSMSRRINAHLFAFPDPGFIDLPNAERQGVFPKAVPFSATKKILHAENMEDLMRAGLQILSFKEKADDLGGWDFVKNTMKEQNVDLFGFISLMMKEGKIVWENQARGIDPHPQLAKAIGAAPPARPKSPRSGPS